MADGGVAGDQAHRVALADHQEAQGGGQCLGISELGLTSRAVAHRAGRVQDEGCPQLGLLFVLADVVAVATGIDQPIQMPQVVPGLIFAMPGKLDREAAAYRAVLARKNALHGLARGHAQVAQPFNDLLVDFVEQGHRSVSDLLPAGLKVGDEALDQEVGGQPAGLGGEIADHSMAQHRLGQDVDVFGRHMIAAPEQGAGFAAQDELLSGAGPAPHRSHLVASGTSRTPGRVE